MTDHTSAGFFFHARLPKGHESFPESCRYVLDTLAEVYNFDQIAKEQSLDANARLRFHQENSAPLMDKLNEWLNVRIPAKSAAHSGRSRPPVPFDSGHPFRRKPATFWEPSDAVFLPHKFPILSQLSFLLSHRISFQFHFVSVVNQTVEYGISQGRIINHLMPVRYWQLARDHG